MGGKVQHVVAGVANVMLEPAKTVELGQAMVPCHTTFDAVVAEGGVVNVASYSEAVGEEDQEVLDQERVGH